MRPWLCMCLSNGAAQQLGVSQGAVGPHKGQPEKELSQHWKVVAAPAASQGLELCLASSHAPLDSAGLSIPHYSHTTILVLSLNYSLFLADICIRGMALTSLMGCAAPRSTFHSFPDPVLTSPGPFPSICTASVETGAAGACKGCKRNLAACLEE